jgi:hypothetical protein
MLISRVVPVLVCTGMLSLAACGKDSSTSSTTSPTPVAAEATVTENFDASVTVGGGVFYSFNIASYGNVAVTLKSVTGPNLPEAVLVSVGVGRPSGTGCTTTTAVSVGPGDSPQLTGVWGPGIYCVRIYDGGALTGTVRVSASVAHP